ncbi:MAG: glycosyltransferase, partial [Gemmatimonadota bacterium]
RPDQVEVIHIGKDTGVFRPGRSDALRQAWRLAGDAVLLGVTSQLEESKGHALLLDALHRLGHQEIHLAIVGEGSHREFLVRRAEALGLGGRVHFLGFSRALPDLLRCLDGFVLPSLSEGFPNTLVEAMATGLPCVATRVCGIPEIIEHGRTGLLVEAGDGEGLAAALKNLVADPTLRASLGSQARQRVEAAFGLEAATDRFEAYLRAIIADGRGRAGWWGAR